MTKDDFNIAINDIEKNSSKLNQVKQKMERMRRKSVAIIGDVSQDEQVEIMMKNTFDKLGSLNVWIFRSFFCLFVYLINIL